jgi:hypothetical protein
MCFGNAQKNTCPGKGFIIEVSGFNDFLLNGLQTVKMYDLFKIGQIAQGDHPLDDQSPVADIIKILQVDVPEKSVR